MATAQAYTHAVGVLLTAIEPVLKPWRAIPDHQLAAARRKGSTIPALGKLDPGTALLVRTAVDVLLSGLDDQPTENSLHLEAFLNKLRSSGTVLHGTNAQVAYLIRDALDVVRPESSRAVEDSEALCVDFDVMASAIRERSDVEDSGDYADDPEEGEE